MNDLERLKNLTEKLNRASDVYYNTGLSFMSDQEFDLKLEELKSLEDEIGISLANSPTKTPGFLVKNEITKVKHDHFMLSLNKCHSLDEIQKFINEHDTIISVKMDGLTISAEYDDDGVLCKLETRGNGIEGNDVLFHSSSFLNLPQRINKKGGYVIDGECVITYSDFETINSTLSNDEKYANPRNLASGSLSLLDTSISKKRFLRFVAWNVINGDNDNDFATKLKNAEQLGFTVVPYVIIDKENISKDYLQKALDEVKELAFNNGYPMDGAVISMRDVEYGLSLGKTDKFFRHSIAYKYEDDSYPTLLKDIEWTMGKTGILTPTAVFSPVEIDGTIVERASLHNVSVMKSLYNEQWNNGLKVYVYKANMIIPQISKVEFEESSFTKKLDPPNVCPICGRPTEIRKDNESEVLVCTNEDCKGKLLGRLSHFVSKNAMNIDGLSEATLDFLIKRGWVNSFIDLYSLFQYRDKWIRYDGFGIKSVDKLLSNIEKSKNTNLTRFIYSLSCPLIGNTASKSISKNISSYTDFIDKVKSHYDWTILDDFGQKMSDSLNQFFNEHLEEVDELSKLMTFEGKATKITGTLKDLSNLTFVITGSVHVFHNRDEIKNAIEEHNGKVTGSVTSKTSFLVCNEISNSGKSKKARELGIKQITEEDLVSMMF